MWDLHTIKEKRKKKKKSPYKKEENTVCVRKKKKKKRITHSVFVCATFPTETLDGHHAVLALFQKSRHTNRAGVVIHFF